MKSALKQGGATKCNKGDLDLTADVHVVSSNNIPVYFCCLQITVTSDELSTAVLTETWYTNTLFYNYSKVTETVTEPPLPPQDNLAGGTSVMFSNFLMTCWIKQ